jgi:hypothetical protein
MTKLKIDNNIFIAIFITIFITFWLWPLWNMNGLAVVSDANGYLQKIEAFKVTLIEYKQFPQNNPWIRGGQPLSVLILSPFSVQFWLALIFETKIAISYYILFCFLILFYGSYKLSSFYFKETLFKYSFALLSIFNIGLLFQLKGGHFVFLSFCYFPLILYFLFKHRSMKYSGIFSGYFYGLMLDTDVAYMSSYCALILLIYIIYFFLNFKNKSREKLIRWIYLFTLTALCVVGYKLNLLLEIQGEFPRNDGGSGYYSNLFSLVKSYLIPYYELSGNTFPGRRFCQSTWENSVYIGVIGFIFIYYSFKNSLNLIHYIVILLFLLQLGTKPFLPYGILQNLPVFDSHTCYNRIRSFNSFYLSFLILFGFHYISQNKSVFKSKLQKLYKYRNYLLIFVILERLLTSHLLIYNTHKDYKDANTFSKYFVPFKNYEILKNFKNNEKFFNYSLLPTYEATKQNIGVMRWDGESFFNFTSYIEDGYFGPYAKDEVEYKGEFTVDEKIIEPSYWSPNLIIFKNLELNKKLKLNMSPNRGWKLNNQDLFPKNNIWDHNKEFTINITEPNITLKYEVPGKKRGIIINFSILFILLISLFYFRKKT